jgi:2-polyprenyl-6-hydroxyphenyl methylase/3-demethylubiquinone-9 3-methyltransferase
MKLARYITPASEDEAFVHAFDLRDIDASNPYDFWRLKYLDRIHAILRRVRYYARPGARTLEIGAAQGNISLLLAEAGYDATAVDLRKDFLDYSRKKYERGSMNWICGNAFELPFEAQFDAVILAEIIEHVAHPDDLIARSLTLVAPGGILVVTTPNHRFLRERSPSYSIACKDVAHMEDEQFGPAGEHHLFTLTMDELRSMVPPNGVVVEEWFMDSVFFNGHMQALWNNATTRSVLLPLAHRLRSVPLAREFVNAGLLMVVQKRADD